jgi:V-type H+-transporting ATPase subunit C
MTQFNQLNAELVSFDRKRRKANLLTRDLSDYARKIEQFKSGYFESFFVVIPTFQKKTWFEIYEKDIVPESVLPESSILLAEEEDYSLVTVTIMKRKLQEFIAEAAKHKY